MCVCFFQFFTNTTIFLSFRTDRSGQTVQTQIRLLLEEQSDQGLHCLQFPLHLLDALLQGNAILFCSASRLIAINFRVSEILGFLRYFYAETTGCIIQYTCIRFASRRIRHREFKERLFSFFSVFQSEISVGKDGVYMSNYPQRAVDDVSDTSVL